MASGTLSPDPWLTVLDANGNPVSGALINTYLAGTLTRVATYTDVALAVANANPIVADSAGRYVAFLSPGSSYKFVITDASAVAIRTQDNISAVPATSGNVDITGVAGEALTAGQAVYLSDGSGSKNAGSWYKFDSTNAYSSVYPQVGMATANIVIGASGTIRLAGLVTGLAALTVGTSYYGSTAGTTTSTAPANRRFLGVADTTSSLVLTPNPPFPIQPWVNDFRLTLTTALPVTTADVTAATTLFCSPLVGNRIDLPDSTGNPLRYTSAEFSIAIPATTSQAYDVFAFNNAGVPTLELLAWTNDTTRATAIIRTANGRLYKTGDLTRMYLGSVRTTTVSGQTEDSFTKRYLWNYYNRVARPVRRLEATGTWAYSLDAWHQANAAAANQIAVLCGVSEDLIELHVQSSASNDQPVNTVGFEVAIGEDSTTVPSTVGVWSSTFNVAANVTSQLNGSLRTIPAVGLHTYAWIERVTAAGITTWRGITGTITQSGIIGTWRS